jgi:hypothetical protein
MKKHKFNVELEFDSKIVSDEDIFEIMTNILDSLVHTANTANIVPYLSDNYTTKITVSNDFIQSKIEREV